MEIYNDVLSLKSQTSSGFLNEEEAVDIRDYFYSAVFLLTGRCGEDIWDTCWGCGIMQYLFTISFFCSLPSHSPFYPRSVDYGVMAYLLSG